LVSYADFITLLFAFFVVMFASSQVNRKKVTSIAAYFDAYLNDKKITPPEVVQPPSHARTPGELQPVQARLREQLSAELEEGRITISMQPRGLVLSLRESALFPPGRDTVNTEALSILAKIAQALQKLPGQPVRLEGHTDNLPIETSQFPSNWELSVARATAVLGLLCNRFQIEPGRLAVAGYADFHPVASNHTAEGRAHNRRVDIVVLSHSAAAMEPHQQDRNP